MSVANELRELLLARADGHIGAEEFELKQAELHARLLEQAPGERRRRLLWILSAAIAVAVAMAAGFYFKPDSRKADMVVDINQMPASTSLPASMVEPKPENAGGDLNVMVKRLADRLEKEPGNAEGWILLARTYTELHQPREAVKAYARADTISPLIDATMLADWADARVLINERKWDQESRDVVKRALASDPKHLKALALAGSEAFSQADYKRAVSYWKRLQAAAPAGSMDARLAEANIREVNDILAGKKPGQNRK